MRIGLVGLGRIGAFHAETLSGLPAVDTLVITDAREGVGDEVAARLRAGHPQARVEVVRPEELLAAGLDGLVVATATNGHAEWIRRGIEGGVATFCEKPCSTCSICTDWATIASNSSREGSTRWKLAP